MRLRMVRMIVIMQTMKRRRILNSGKLREKKPYYSLAVSNDQSNGYCRGGDNENGEAD